MSQTATSRRVAPSTAAEPARPRESHRETVEAIVVAFILALLVRGFEAEAFVIPTGSMAPTLMGRHKEITCPQCGHVYSVNASEEVEGFAAANPRIGRVYTGICVNCRYQARVDETPSFKGDRILVMKFPYDLPWLPGSAPPRRWDVVVFRYPEEPEVSYIKRLIGLPGEELRIWFGDIYIKPPGGDAFHLERKPLAHQRAMQMLVYDDAHRAAAVRDRPEWRRWSSPSADQGWREESPGEFRAPGAGDDWAELRYRHLVPDPEQWEAILEQRDLPRPARATLITDFYSYNTNLTMDNSSLTSYHRGDQEAAWMQPHWVGDLTLSARLDVKATGGSVRFELIEGGVANRCEIDLTSGAARLLHGDRALNPGQGPTAISGPGTYDLVFANVDNRLTLLVNGRPIFGDGLIYEDESGTHPAPTAADLSPVAIASRAASVAVSDLVVKRDIYYTLYPGRSDYSSVWDQPYPGNPVELFDVLSDPAQFAALGKLKSHEYPIGEDRYMMLGDNSPRSKDSRGWSNGDSDWDPTNRASWEVPRSLLTGKAFFVYWPHGVPLWPDLRINRDFRFPFRPYVERMKWIR
jgi:signal peptidase I